MTDNGRGGNNAPAKTNIKGNDRNNETSKRDEQLDEEIRGQLRKKHEENKRHLSPGKNER